MYFKSSLWANSRFILFLIVVFGLILRLIFFSGMGISDDLVYSRYAYNIDKGIDLEGSLTLSTRIGILYATFMSYKLFGVNDLSSVLFVLVTSIGNIILVFYFAKLLFNEKTGLMAAFLMAIFPIEVANSTRLLTDIPSAFFMALGVYFFLYAERKSKLKYQYFLSGIFIGIGYLIRESAVLIVLFFLIYVLYKKRIKKEYFLVPLGFILIFSIELLTLYKLTGDPLFKFTTVQDYLSQANIEVNYFGRRSFPEGLFHYPYVILTNSLISYFYILIFIAIAYLFIYKKKPAYVLMLWFIPLLLYLSFGSGSFTVYAPFKAEPRYLSVITAPGILLLAFFLMQKGDFIKRIMPITLLLLSAASIATLYLQEDITIINNLRELYPHIEDLDKTVYMDSRSINAFYYISGYQMNVNLKEYPNNLSEIKDAYVVVNRGMIRNIREAYKDIKFPKEVDEPPKGWTNLKEAGEGDNKIILYRV